MPDNQWAESQKASLIDVGVHPLDAESIVTQIMEDMPSGVDPDTWIPTPDTATDITWGHPETVTDAKAEWYASDDVPQAYRMLLGATPVEDEDEGRDATGVAIAGLLAYLWLRNRRQYYTAKPFRPVAVLRIRRLLDTHVGAQESLFADLVTSFHEQALAASVWNRYMELAVQRQHLQYRAMGSGGFANMDDSDYQSIDLELGAERSRLPEFAGAVVIGALTLAQAQARARMYVGTSRMEYWRGQDRQHGKPRGDGLVDIGRRVLGASEHCGDCVSYYDSGWTYPGETPEPGSGSQCRSNCKCHRLYRAVPFDEVDSWLGTKR